MASCDNMMDLENGTRRIMANGAPLLLAAVVRLDDPRYPAPLPVVRQRWGWLRYDTVPCAAHVSEVRITATDRALPPTGA